MNEYFSFPGRLLVIQTPERGWCDGGVKAAEIKVMKNLNFEAATKKREILTRKAEI